MVSDIDSTLRRERETCVGSAIRPTIAHAARFIFYTAKCYIGAHKLTVNKTQFFSVEAIGEKCIYDISATNLHNKAF